MSLCLAVFTCVRESDGLFFSDCNYRVLIEGLVF